MMSFLKQLKQQNPLLYWFGLFNLMVGLACLAAIPFDDTAILGVDRWLKPMKFYLAVGIMTLTMGWVFQYLNNRKRVKRYSWILVITMLFENGCILMQSFRSTTSHFNSRTPFDSIVFSVMGILIMIFTIATITITIVFFRQKKFSIPPSYVWGIRLGLLFFIFFSLEGGIMVSLLKHTIGATDGGTGLPLINWSRDHGDLRVAHFLGIHSLQILPLLGFYVAKTKKQIIVLSSLYFLLVLCVLIQALSGIPLFF